MPGLSTYNADGPSLFRDIRTGDAGAVARVAISLATGLVLVAAALVVIWAVQQAGGNRRGDGTIAAALGGAGLAWCLAQMWVWHSYRRFRMLLNGIFSVIAIWVVVVPICVMIESAFQRNEELLIAGCILCGVAATLLRMAVLWHRKSRGKALTDIEGRINLNCPNCGYVMLGLSESRCPECGARFTLDELVRRQDYHVLRSVDRATRPPPIETHEAMRPALEGG